MARLDGRFGGRLCGRFHDVVAGDGLPRLRARLTATAGAGFSLRQTHLLTAALGATAGLSAGMGARLRADLSAGASLSGAVGNGFDPSDLSPLAWFDPSDLSTLWKDTAGTDPVTADGDSVARIDDRSGNDYHATQATASQRPIYKTSGGLHWLQFDGIDDFLSAPAFLDSAGMLGVLGAAIDTTGVHQAPYAQRGTLLGDTVYKNPANEFEHWYGTGAGWEIVTGDSIDASAKVLTARRSGTTHAVRVNSTTEDTHSGGAFASTTNVFRVGSNDSGYHSAMNFYALVICAGATDDATDGALLRTWVAAKSGVTL